MEAHNLEKTYEIKGMTCAACVARVEKAIAKIPEVKEVAVNLATERARIVFREPVSDEVVEQFVHKTGYEAKLFVDELDAQNQNSESTNTSSERIYSQLREEKTRLALAVILTLPLLMPMVSELLGGSFTLNGTLQAVLAAIVQFGLGARFYRGAYFALRSRSPNMDVLVCLGTLSAFGLSFYYLLAHGSSHPHFYFETSAFITTLVMLGKYLESQAKSKTGAAIQKLKALRPSTVRVIRNSNGNTTDGSNIKETDVKETDAETVVSLSAIRSGDRVRIRPGEVIPADGIVMKGTSEVNEALLTGESLPVLKEPGSPVSGGSVNSDGALEIELTGNASESLLSRMISLIEKAQEKKAPIQRLADQVSAVFVPVVLGIALLTLVIWGLITHDWERALMHAVGVLVIACPCALGLATPTAIRVGMGIAAKKGILVRDAEVLETLHSLTEIAFDKTGTLTEGNFSISWLQTAQGISEVSFLERVASLQSQSEHPLAKAILQRALIQKVSFPTPHALRAIPGQGIEGEIDGTHYFFGNAKGIQARGGVIENEQGMNIGETISYLMDLGSKKVLGQVGFQDTLRPDSVDAVKNLHQLGARVILLSGDRWEAASRIGETAHVDEIQAPLSPEEKTAFIRGRIDEGVRIGMVGDGLNDGPALATASVGFALSTGTDVSISVAGVTLLRPDLRLIAESILLSQKIYRKIKQNLFWAFAYNVLGIPLAAFGYLSPMVAGAAMALSSVSVVLNSLSLSRITK